MPANLWWIWIILGVLFVVGEIFTAAFFLLWFGIGAGVAAILAFLGLGFAWQLAAFVVVPAILIPVSRRFAERVSKPQPPGIGADRFAGNDGIVIETINNLENTGRVRVDRDEWRAESADGDEIANGETVRVTGMSGTHVVVTRINKGD